MAERSESPGGAAGVDFAALVVAHHAPLYRYAYRLCGRPADAEPRGIQRRQEAQGAPGVEVPECDAAGLGFLADEERCDEKAAEDEEDVDADFPVLGPPPHVGRTREQPQVDGHDEEHRDRAHAVEGRNEGKLKGRGPRSPGVHPYPG